VIVTKVLNNGRGFDRGRVKVVKISAVTYVALQIALVAVWINHNKSQILSNHLFYHIVYNNLNWTIILYILRWLK
jgi:hypothetical protein